VKVAAARLRAISALAAYSLAGALSSALVGAAFGLMGQFLMRGTRVIPVLISAFTAVLFVLQQFRVLPFPTPEFSRQTKAVWQRVFHPVVAAALWGLDLGLVLTTRQAFSGAWPIVVLAVCLASPAMGAGLIGSYWLGRLAPVWIVPVLLRDAGDTHRLLTHLFGHHWLLQRIHVIGLIWGVGAITYFGFGGP
jgi:hypothetical protein